MKHIPFLFISLLITLCIKMVCLIALLIVTVTAHGQDTLRVGSLSVVDVDTFFAHQIISELDTTFICSRGFIEAYRECRQSAQQFEAAIAGFDELIEMFAALDTATKVMAQSLNSLETSYQTLLTDNRTDLERFKALNESIGLELATTKENLLDAKNQIRRARWASIGSKVVLGVGGLAVGIVGGAILLK